jgi:hypothetical protein
MDFSTTSESNKEFEKEKGYGKRGKIGTRPQVYLANTEQEKFMPSIDYIHPGRFISRDMETQRKVPQEGNFYSDEKPKSFMNTPNKQKTEEWLRRLYQSMSDKEITPEILPDIVTGNKVMNASEEPDTNPMLANGYMEPYGANRVVVGVKDPEGDIDINDPRERGVAFHETGHVLTGLKDSAIPSTEEFVPFYKRNVTPYREGTSSEQRVAEHTMQPFDTVYTTLKDKLDKEHSVRRRALGSPNLIDRAMTFFTGEESIPQHNPSDYYNASAMRKQMLEDNTASIKAADERLKQKNTRMQALQQMQNNPSPPTNGRRGFNVPN